MDAFEFTIFPEGISVATVKATGSESMNNLLTNGKLKYTNYKVGSKMEF